MKAYTTIMHIMKQVWLLLVERHDFSKSTPILEALFSGFLVSHLGDEDYCGDQPTQDLYKSYSESHFMVNINSDLMPQIMAIQAFKNEFKVHQRAQNEYDKLTRDFFFYETKAKKVKTFLRQIRMDRLTEHWKTISKSDDEFAFVVDLDAQFIFVPKAWVRDSMM